MGIRFLDGCQSGGFCRRIGTMTVQAIAPDGSIADEMLVCAYCAEEISAPAGYTIRITDSTGGDNDR